MKLNASHLRLRNMLWPSLTDLEQRAVEVAAALASDSAHIPIIAAEIISKFDPKRHPEHPQPEYSI